VILQNATKAGVVNPTPAEVHKYCMDKLDKYEGDPEGERRTKEENGKPVYGPERPTGKK
jgi:hypothetical protein